MSWRKAKEEEETRTIRNHCQEEVGIASEYTLLL
jgi:hypothetical protein